jgi:hypothetical protein
VCELAIPLELLAVTFCKISINPITDPDPVFSRYHVTVIIISCKAFAVVNKEFWDLLQGLRVLNGISLLGCKFTLRKQGKGCRIASEIRKMGFVEIAVT